MRLGFPGGSETERICLPMQELHIRFQGQEDPLEKGMATLVQDIFLENHMDKGAWWATVHGVTKSWTLLSN